MEDILNFRGLFPCCRGNIQRREDGKFMGDTTQIMLTMIAYMLVVIGIAIMGFFDMGFNAAECGRAARSGGPFCILSDFYRVRHRNTS